MIADGEARACRGPGLPHHVTQRGNRRQMVFFSDDDYRAYRALVAEHCAAAGVAVWAHCPMPSHVHLILVPSGITVTVTELIAVAAIVPYLFAMARIARIVVPGLPHHVTQRGNRREQVFFSDDDYRVYVDLLAEALETSASQIWAWCLMPNHVHLIVVPAQEDGIRATVANAHRRYAARINARNHWTGHFWQGRYGSVAMDEAHLHSALAYVTLNPVRARLVDRAEQWRWSSVHAHLAGRDDAITTVAPALSRVGDFAAFLDGRFDDGAFEPIRRSELVGRPIGSAHFIAGLERKLGRPLAPRKRGRKVAVAE